MYTNFAFQKCISWIKYIYSKNISGIIIYSFKDMFMEYVCFFYKISLRN